MALIKLEYDVFGCLYGGFRIILDVFVLLFCDRLLILLVVVGFLVV